MTSQHLGNMSPFRSTHTYPGEAVDGCLAGAVGRVVVKCEEGGSARDAHNLSTFTPGNHPLRAFLAEDERRPHVHL